MKSASLPDIIPCCLTIEHLTPESAVLKDAKRQLDEFRKLIEPDDTTWSGELKPSVVVTRVHAGPESAMSGMVYSLRGGAGEIFIKSDGRVIRLGNSKTRSFQPWTPTAQHIFKWTTHIAFWIWPDELSGTQKIDFLMDGLAAWGKPDLLSKALLLEERENAADQLHGN